MAKKQWFESWKSLEAHTWDLRLRLEHRPLESLQAVIRNYICLQEVPANAGVQAPSATDISAVAGIGHGTLFPMPARRKRASMLDRFRTGGRGRSTGWVRENRLDIK